MRVHPMELTNFHLGRHQKQALKERAKAHGTNIAEEIRSAIEAYLSGVTPEELELLDVATKHAERTIAEMTQMLDEINDKARRVFDELEALRGGSPAEPRAGAQR